MFYEVKIKSYIRVSPTYFNLDTEEAILKQLNEQFDGFISKELGFVIGVSGVDEVGEGIVVPGDGAAYYSTIFKIFTFKPDMQEIVHGRITDITDFGAFLDIGVVDGMIHISQTMDDYVTFNKTSNVLAGKESKKVLKINDDCVARIIAVSYKNIRDPKIGLTMRQPGLGSTKWFDEESLKDKIKKKIRVVKKK